LVASRTGLKLENHNYLKLQFGRSKQLANFLFIGGVLFLLKRNISNFNTVAIKRQSGFCNKTDIKNVIGFDSGLDKPTLWVGPGGFLIQNNCFY